jgi:hypothetical protein
MSGFEVAAAVFGMVAGTIDLIHKSIEIYGAVKDKAGIPKALMKVSDKLPSLEELLRGAQAQYEEGKLNTIDNQTWDIAKQEIEQCKELCQELHDLLLSSYPKADAGKAGRLWKGTKTVFSGNAKDVEVLVEEILEHSAILAKLAIINNMTVSDRARHYSWGTVAATSNSTVFVSHLQKRYPSRSCYVLEEPSPLRSCYVPEGPSPLRTAPALLDSHTGLYNPLDESLKEIRLLSVTSYEAPEGAAIQIQCVMSTLSLLKPDVDYDALSYAWGTTNNPGTVTINDQDIHITRNLYQALVSLTKHKQLTRFVWIDAICINQADRAERGSQVALMKNIYSGAKNVRIYLGESSSMTDSLIKMAIAVKDGTSIRSWMQDGVLQTKHLRHIFSFSWWTRVWVLQEATLASFPVVHCGPSRIPFWQLVRFAVLVRDAIIVGSLADFTDPSSGQERSDQSLWFQTLDRVVWAYDQLRNQNLSADYLLNVSSYFDATLYHDRIYGLLSLMSPAPNIRPSYEKDIEEVLEEVAVKTMIQLKTLRLLRLVRLQRRLIVSDSSLAKASTADSDGFISLPTQVRYMDGASTPPHSSTPQHVSYEADLEVPDVPDGYNPLPDLSDCRATHASSTIATSEYTSFSSITDRVSWVPSFLGNTSGIIGLHPDKFGTTQMPITSSFFMKHNPIDHTIWVNAVFVDTICKVSERKAELHEGFDPDMLRTKLRCWQDLTKIPGTQESGGFRSQFWETVLCGGIFNLVSGREGRDWTQDINAYESWLQPGSVSVLPAYLRHQLNLLASASTFFMTLSGRMGISRSDVCERDHIVLLGGEVIPYIIYEDVRVDRFRVTGSCYCSGA